MTRRTAVSQSIAEIAEIAERDHARRAAAIILFCQGAATGNWVTRLASIKIDLHLSSGGLGLALAGTPAGLGIAAVLLPKVSARWSSASTARWGIGAAALAIVIPAVAWSEASLAVGLIVLGAAFGVSDISVNVEALAVERSVGRPIMSGLHAKWSLGLLAGSLVSSAAAHARVPPLSQLTVAAIVLCALGVRSAGDLLGADHWTQAPPGTAPSGTAPSGTAPSGTAPPDTAPSGTASPDTAPPPQAEAIATHPRAQRFWGHPALLTLAVIAFCSFLVEGSVVDWSGVYLHTGQHASLGLAALGVTVYSAGAIIGRLLGNRVVERLGRTSTLWRTALVGAAGMGIAVAARSAGLALAGYAVLGLGVAVIVPVALSLTGALGGRSSSLAVSRVTLFAYAGLFLGPPVIGAVAGITDLSVGLCIPCAMLLVVSVLSGRMGRLTAAAQP